MIYIQGNSVRGQTILNVLTTVLGNPSKILARS